MSQGLKMSHDNQHTTQNFPIGHTITQSQSTDENAILYMYKYLLQVPEWFGRQKI